MRRRRTPDRTWPVVARPLRSALVAAVLAALLVVAFGVSAATMLSTDTGVYFRPADQFSIAAIGVLLACGLLLAARPRLRADADGVEVRNVGSSRTLPWSAVRHVAFPDGARWARLELDDDEYLGVLAIQSLDGERAVDAIRRVRALHAAARAQH